MSRPIEALRGCPRMSIETLGFQAPGFYEKRGYLVASRFDGFPPSGVRYALTKELSRGRHTRPDESQAIDSEEASCG